MRINLISTAILERTAENFFKVFKSDISQSAIDEDVEDLDVRNARRFRIPDNSLGKGVNAITESRSVHLCVPSSLREALEAEKGHAIAGNALAVLHGALHTVGRASHAALRAGSGPLEGFVDHDLVEDAASNVQDLQALL